MDFFFADNGGKIFFLTKIDEFANSVDPDEVAHYEPSHLDLHCSLSILKILIMI